MANIYNVGMDVMLSGAFFNLSKDPVDPTTITLKVRKAGSSITSYVYGTDPDVVKTSTGVYYRKYTPASSGTYYYRWEGTGTLSSANESTFEVIATNF